MLIACIVVEDVPVLLRLNPDTYKVQIFDPCFGDDEDRVEHLKCVVG